MKNFYFLRFILFISLTFFIKNSFSIGFEENLGVYSISNSALLPLKKYNENSTQSNLVPIKKNDRVFKERGFRMIFGRGFYRYDVRDNFGNLVENKMLNSLNISLEFNRSKRTRKLGPFTYFSKVQLSYSRFDGIEKVYPEGLVGYSSESLVMKKSFFGMGIMPQIRWRNEILGLVISPGLYRYDVKLTGSDKSLPDEMRKNTAFLRTGMYFQHNLTSKKNTEIIFVRFGYELFFSGHSDLTKHFVISIGI